MKASLFTAAFALVATLHAQDLAPELAPLAAKNKANLTALDAQKAAAVGRVVQTYSAALDAAENVETTAGRLTAVAAITTERRAVEKNEVTAAFPDTLPKGLQKARKNYFDGIARVAADFGQRQQRVNADYLRDLRTLQTRFGSNRVIAEQIAAEKERLLARTTKIPVMPFAGVWNITYANGFASRYTIDNEGNVSWDGHTTKIQVHGDDHLIEWGREDKIERISRAGSDLLIEYFSPKSEYPRKVTLRGKGTKAKP